MASIPGQIDAVELAADGLPAQPALTASEWRSYWPMVMAAAIGFSFNSIITQAIGLFIKPLSETFGWSHAEIVIGLPIVSAMGIVLTPIAGAAIDKLGARRVALLGLGLLAPLFATFGLANGSTTQWLAMWVGYGLVGMMVCSTIWVTAVSTVFHKNRSLAIATVLSGAALAQIITPPLVERLIAVFGWRQAFVTLGLGWGGIAFVLNLLFLYDARDRSRRAPGKNAHSAVLAAGLSFKEAFRKPAIIRIAIAAFVSILMQVAVLVMQVPILTEAGVARQNAAMLASITGVAALMGKLTTGWLMDRIDAGIVGAVTLALSAIAFPFIQVHSVPVIIAAMFVIGYAGGTKLQVCAYLIGRYAGLKNYGRIFGTIGSLIALGSGLGPLLAGAMHDATGNYLAFLIVACVSTLLISPLIVGLGSYPDWEKTPA